MFIQTTDVLASSLQGLWMGFISFVPALLLALIVFIIGWVIASVVGKALEQVFDAIKIDNVFKSAGIDDVFNKAGIKFSVGGFIGGLVKWFIIIAFLVASLEIIGLREVTAFLRDVVLGYLPQVFIATLVLVIASVLAMAMRRIVNSSARAANIRSADMLGGMAYYAIWIFGFLIALNELGIAPQFMQILFTGIIAMLAIAGGLAFGLGGKDAASRTIEKVRSDMSSR